MAKKSKKWILEHYECDGQLSIDDLPFTDKNVDNFVTDVDNNTRNIDWNKFSTECVIICCEICDKWFDDHRGCD